METMTMSTPKPRRANARWLDADCPAGVLAIFDDGGKTHDRFTILYVPEPGAERVDYLAASAHPFDPQGFGQHGDMSLSNARAYRYRAASWHESATWSSLPEDVKRVVRADLGVSE